MTTLFRALDPEEKEELICGDVIELVSVIVTAVPDPDRPDDWLKMKIAVEVYDNFAPGTPWIDAELEKVREICAGAAEDITVLAEDALHVALNRNRKDRNCLLAGKVGGHPAVWASDPQFMASLGPVLQNARAEELVWWLAWTVAMDDDGKIVVDLRGLPVASAPGGCAAVSRPGFVLCGRWDGRDPEKYSGADADGVVGRGVGDLMGGE